MRKRNAIWPEVFKTGVIPEGRDEKSLCADALVGWGNCYLEPPPANFGIGMAEISKRLNVIGTAESFLEWLDKRIKE